MRWCCATTAPRGVPTPCRAPENRSGIIPNVPALIGLDGWQERALAPHLADGGPKPASATRELLSGPSLRARTSATDPTPSSEASGRY